MAEPRDIIDRLWWVQCAGCTCGTKSPEAKYHKEDCRYAVVMDAIEEIKALREENEMLLGDPSDG